MKVVRAFASVLCILWLANLSYAQLWVSEDKKVSTRFHVNPTDCTGAERIASLSFSCVPVCEVEPPVRSIIGGNTQNNIDAILNVNDFDMFGPSNNAALSPSLTQNSRIMLTGSSKTGTVYGLRWSQDVANGIGGSRTVDLMIGATRGSATATISCTVLASQQYCQASGSATVNDGDYIWVRITKNLTPGAISSAGWTAILAESP